MCNTSYMRFNNRQSDLMMTFGGTVWQKSRGNLCEEEFPLSLAKVSFPAVQSGTLKRLAPAIINSVTEVTH